MLKVLSLCEKIHLRCWYLAGKKQVHWGQLFPGQIYLSAATLNWLDYLVQKFNTTPWDYSL